MKHVITSLHSCGEFDGSAAKLSGLILKCVDRMPLTMEPNFEDMSCLMTFGLTPPASEEDVVFKQKCCSSACPTSNPAAEVCPKLR